MTNAAHKYEELMKNDHESRITRLEVTIENVNSTLFRIEKRLDVMDSDMKSGFKDINNRLWSNFIWMIGGFIGILGLIAHTSHWI